MNAGLPLLVRSANETLVNQVYHLITCHTCVHTARLRVSAHKNFDKFALPDLPDLLSSVLAVLSMSPLLQPWSPWSIVMAQDNVSDSSSPAAKLALHVASCGHTTLRCDYLTIVMMCIFVSHIPAGKARSRHTAQNSHGGTTVDTKII